MKKLKIFLGAYVNHVNAQNINCKSIALHLDKEKYKIKTLLLGSENVPKLPNVNYIRVSTLLYSISNLIAFIRGIIWADVCYIPKHQSTPKLALFIAPIFRTKLFTTIEGNMCDVNRCNMINSFGSIEKMKSYFSYIPNIYGITNDIIMNAKCGVKINHNTLSLGVEKETFYNKINKESLKNIVFIGSLVQRKNVKEFVDLSNHFPNINFNIVGTGPELVNLKNNAGINVIFHDGLNHEDLSILLMNMDLHFLPSKSEGFPKVILETAAASIPSVIYDSYGGDEWISNYDNGFLVSDISQVKNLISELLEHPKILVNCSKNVLEIAERFDWKEVIKQWEKVIDELK